MAEAQERVGTWLSDAPLQGFSLARWEAQLSAHLHCLHHFCLDQSPAGTHRIHHPIIWRLRYPAPVCPPKCWPPILPAQLFRVS